MAALAKLAQERDCGRLELSVLDWNPTRDFYHAIDCTHMEAWLPYRMDGAAILALAAEAPDVTKWVDGIRGSSVDPSTDR